MGFKLAAKKITAWSYSRWRDYEKCPQLAKFKHVDKMKEPGNAAMNRGSEIHKMAEEYAGGKLKKMPAELAKFKTAFTALKKSNPLCEQDWAFTDTWGLTGWFDGNAWLRVKVDAAYELKTTVVIIDHKTGQVKDDYADQCELYAIAGMLVFPNAEEIHTKLWFLDHGEERVMVYAKRELEALKKKWLKQTKNMLTDTRFPPRPGNYCRFCHFRKTNGGPCQY